MLKFEECPTCGGFPSFPEMSGTVRHVCPPKWKVRLEDQQPAESRIVYARNAERAVAEFLKALGHTEDVVTGDQVAIAFCPETGAEETYSIESEATIIYTLTQMKPDITADK